MEQGGGKHTEPTETWKDWALFALFGMALLTPASFGAWTLHHSGLPIGITILMIGLSLPALLVPVLPKKRRVAVMRAGWPARVAFGVPGLMMGILMTQFAILEVGRVPFVNTLSIMTFGGMMAFLGGLLLFPNLTDTHSTED